MEATHIRNSLIIHRYTLVLALLCTLLFPAQGRAQRSKRSQIGEYAKVIHFGFTVGSNASTFKYDFSPNYWQHNPDTFTNIRIKSYPGLTLGAVGDLHLGRSYLGEHMDLRFIPSLVLSTRQIQYSYRKGPTPLTKDVECALIEFPVLLKFKSDRFNNFRFYTIGGFKYGYDLASNSTANRNPTNPIIALKPHNFSYEYGAGLDFYFHFFKFSPEVKFSKGINNVFAPNADPFSVMFTRLRSNFVYFSLYFEG